MDWTPTEMQGAIGDLAKKVLRTSAQPWADLAESGLTEADDLLDLIALLEQVGRAGGTVPALETLVLGAPARRSDDPADVVLTGVPFESGLEVEDGRARGTIDCVPAGTAARRLAFATAAGIWSVALCDCVVVPQVGTNGDDLARVILDGVAARWEGDAEAAEAWRLRSQVGVCALLFGLSREALIMTAKYTAEREQFGRPIATFQAVSQRAADAWIQLNAMELTLTQAAWRLSTGRPAEREVTIARYQASEGAHQIVAAAQHLHGGHGFDRDYALHRYFLTVKAWEMVGGGAAAQLARLGSHLARSGEATAPA